MIRLGVLVDALRRRRARGSGSPVPRPRSSAEALCVGFAARTAFEGAASSGPEAEARNGSPVRWPPTEDSGAAQITGPGSIRDRANSGGCRGRGGIEGPDSGGATGGAGSRRGFRADSVALDARPLAACRFFPPSSEARRRCFLSATPHPHSMFLASREQRAPGPGSSVPEPPPPSPYSDTTRTGSHDGAQAAAHCPQGCPRNGTSYPDRVGFRGRDDNHDAGVRAQSRPGPTTEGVDACGSRPR
ncbi:hypothetical protein ACUXNS_000493 [Brevibacterium pityocampae]